MTVNLGTTTNNGFRFPTATNDGTDFATGIADLAGDIDAYLNQRVLNFRKITSTSTAVVGDLIETAAAGAITVTLPSSPSPNVDDTVDVFNANGQGVTVSTSSTINGMGVSGVTAVQVSAKGAHATFRWEGSSWEIIAGQQDTGWKNVTPASNINITVVGTALQARQQGDRVTIRGGLEVQTTLYTLGAVMWNLPTGIAEPPGEIADTPTGFDSSNNLYVLRGGYFTGGSGYRIFSGVGLPVAGGVVQQTAVPTGVFIPMGMSY